MMDLTNPDTIRFLLFCMLATFTGTCAILVVVSQNIVRSVTFLFFTLAGTAGTFFLLGADFVGAAQLLVYLGATLILVVFGVMLTAQGPFVNLRASAVEWGVGIVVGLMLFGMLAVSIHAESWPDTFRAQGTGRTSSPATSMNGMVLGESLLGIVEATPRGSISGLPPSAIPTERRKVAYLLPFEMVSVHLLVVLIGAAYLARAKRRKAAA